MDAPTSAGSWGGGWVLFWFTSRVDVGGAVEAEGFALLETGDNVDEEFVSITEWNVAVEVFDGIDLASAQRTSKKYND